MSNNIDEQLLENLIEEETEKLLNEINGAEVIKLARNVASKAGRAKGASQIVQDISQSLRKLKLDDINKIDGAALGEVANALGTIRKRLEGVVGDLEASNRQIAKEIQQQLKATEAAIRANSGKIAAKATSKAGAKARPKARYFKKYPSETKLDDAVRVLKIADDIPVSVQKFAKQVDQNPGGALQTLSTKADELRVLPVNQEQNLALAIHKAQKSAPIGTRKFPWQQILAAAGLTIAVALLSQLDSVEKAKADPEKKAKADPEKKKKASGVNPCISFEKLAMRVAGTNDPKLATKTIQELLVNRGYSVIRGQTNSPFAGGGKGTAQEKDFKKLGIDGRCGPGTMGAVERFQRDMINKGINLGKTGPKKDGVDGIVGPKTWSLLTKELAASDPKQKKSKPVSGKFSHPSVNSAVSDSRWDDLFNTYVRARNNVNKAMMRQGRESFLGAEETADKISELQDIVFRKVRLAGLPSLASSGRRPIGGDKKTVALKAAALLDRMMNEPSYFVQLLKDGNFLNDSTVVKAAAKQAIQSILDVKPVNEWKEFSKYSKLWQ